MRINENFQLVRVADIASPKGEEMNYIQKLRELMQEQKLNEAYIQLCCKYAQRLIDNSVPVIFDFKHLSLLLGLDTVEIAFYLFADESMYYQIFNKKSLSG